MLWLLFCLMYFAEQSFAQDVTRSERVDSDGFKWVEIRSNGKRGVETPEGKQLVPLDSYSMIVYQSSYGGYFGVHSLDSKKQGVWSLDGKELISLSRGYDRIFKHKEYFKVVKDGYEGACDFNGNEIISPQYKGLFYSDGFKYGNTPPYTPLGIVMNESGEFVYSNTGKAVLSGKANLGIQSQHQLASSVSMEDSLTESHNTQINTAASYVSGFTSEDKEHYRRSSLCLILLTHRDKKYAEAMERVFKSFPLPARYNEHNITGLRVISVRGKQSKKDIDRIVRSNEVAQKVVARWFNRSSYTGRMNMDLIHERGGYGAFYADYQRAQNNARGTDMLRDEGIELLQSTFVLVCDMDYIDKKKGAGWAAFGTAMLAAGAMTMSAVNQQQANNAYWRGDFAEARRKIQSANAWGAGAYAGAAATAVVADIGGFRVKMSAYLYKLRWNDSLTQTMYRDYWCDYQTPYSDAQSRKEKFDNASYTFALDFVGRYCTTSSKTILRSWNDEDQVILDVCERCVNKGMKELAKTFPIFRPRAPFYFKDDVMYSHIGRKEEVSYGKKYEIVQPFKDKNGQICYKRVGTAQANTPWNNRDIRFDQYFDESQLGTSFFCKNSSIDLHTPGLQIREL